MNGQYFDPTHPPTAANICNIWMLVEPHSDPNNPTDQNAWLEPSSLNYVMENMRGYALNDSYKWYYSPVLQDNCAK